MSNYEIASKKYGTVKFNGCEYALTSDADHTNRLLPGNYINFVDAAEGDAYDFEMSADAIDSEGNQYTVYWLFEGIKGEGDHELDSYDYSDVDRVVKD